MMKRVIECKYCGQPEYYGEFRWISGHMLCRNCYKAHYEKTYKEPYRWDDLDGDRPKKVDEDHMSPSENRAYWGTFG